MPNEEKKGITVKIDAELHAQVRAYIESNGLTMAEFVPQALDHELHSMCICRFIRAICTDFESHFHGVKSHL